MEFLIELIGLFCVIIGLIFAYYQFRYAREQRNSTERKPIQSKLVETAKPKQFALSS